MTSESGENKSLRTTGTILMALVLYAVTANVVFGSLGRMSESFGVQPELFSSAVSVQFASYFIACLFIGILSDRMGKKVMISGACFIAAMGALGWIIAPNLTGPIAELLGNVGINLAPENLAVLTVALGAMLLGAGGGVMEAVGSGILTDLHPDKCRFYMLLSQVAYCIGAIIPTAIMAWLYPMGISWRWFFLATAFACLALGICCALLKLPHNSQGRSGHGTLASSIRILPSVAIPAVCIFFYVFAETSTAAFLGVILKDYMKAPESASIYFLPLFWCAVIIGRFLCAMLPEKLSYESVLATILTCAAATSSLQFFPISWEPCAALYVATGFAFGGIWPMIVSMASSRNLEDSGAASGITISMGGLGAAVSPLVTGRILEYGGHRPFFVVQSAVLLAGAAFMLLSFFLNSRRNKNDK